MKIKGEGEVAHILGSKENVKKADLNERITELNKLRQITELAASVGHEVRNPLATVRGLLQILSNKTSDIKEKEYHKMMIGELDRANSLLEEFLTLTRTKSFHAAWDNLNEIVNSIFPLILASAVNSGKILETEQEDIPDLYVDRCEIIQLILNLVRNALEVTPKSGKVTIKTMVNDGKVILSVQDQGDGIPPEVLKRLGTLFYSTKEGGTGIGLAVCKKIADNHKATISIETSEKGSIFWVSFDQANQVRPVECNDRAGTFFKEGDLFLSLG